MQGSSEGAREVGVLPEMTIYFTIEKSWGQILAIHAGRRLARHSGSLGKMSPWPPCRCRYVKYLERKCPCMQV